MGVILRHGGLGGVVRLDFPHRTSLCAWLGYGVEASLYEACAGQFGYV